MTKKAKTRKAQTLNVTDTAYRNAVRIHFIEEVEKHNEQHDTQLNPKVMTTALFDDYLMDNLGKLYDAGVLHTSLSPRRLASRIAKCVVNAPVNQ